MHSWHAASNENTRKMYPQISTVTRMVVWILGHPWSWIWLRGIQELLDVSKLTSCSLSFSTGHIRSPDRKISLASHLHQHPRRCRFRKDHCVVCVSVSTSESWLLYGSLELLSIGLPSRWGKLWSFLTQLVLTLSLSDRHVHGLTG